MYMQGANPENTAAIRGVSRQRRCVWPAPLTTGHFHLRLLADGIPRLAHSATLAAECHAGEARNCKKAFDNSLPPTQR